MKTLFRFIAVMLLLSLTAAAQDGSAVVRLDPALDDIVAPNAKVEKVAGDFGFTEGPVWVRTGGYLLFSDIPANVINKWNPADDKVSVFLDKSGFTGADATGVGGEQTNVRGQTIYLIGSNGVTLDPQGRVTFNAMGDRQVVRVESDGKRTVLASQYRWQTAEQHERSRLQTKRVALLHRSALRPSAPE